MTNGDAPLISWASLGFSQPFIVNRIGGIGMYFLEFRCAHLESVKSGNADFEEEIAYSALETWHFVAKMHHLERRTCVLPDLGTGRL